MPYPFERWKAVSRADVAQLRRWARCVPMFDVVQVESELREWAGVPCSASFGSIHVCQPGALAHSLSEPLVAVVLRDGERALLVELSPHLAGWIVDRMLGGEGEPAILAGALTNVERGVLAYAAARFTKAPWKVAGVVTTVQSAIAGLGDEGSIVGGWDVTLGEVQGVARLWIPPAVNPPNGACARDVGRLPLTLVLDAGTSMLDADEVRDLRHGDVVLVDTNWWPGRTRATVSGATRTRWWCDARGELVEVETGLESAPHRGRREVDEDITKTVSQVGDAPVSISVELVRFQLTVEELAKVRPGEVITTGAPIGETVHLRAGDKIIARGELVNVEGEVGVRITALSD